MVKISQYAGLQQYTGRASSANSPPPPGREGGPLEAPPEAQKIRVFASFPITIAAQIVLAGGACGHLHRKNKEKVKKNTCGAPLEAPPEAQEIRVFASFPITIGAQYCIILYWGGCLWSFIYTEKVKKK